MGYGKCKFDFCPVACVLHWSESCPSLDIYLILDFLFWHAQDASGYDSIAVQLANESHWDDLVIIISVVCGIPNFFPLCFISLIWYFVAPSSASGLPFAYFPPHFVHPSA